jgi:hypothetical protein
MWATAHNFGDVLGLSFSLSPHRSADQLPGRVADGGVPMIEMRGRTRRVSPNTRCRHQRRDRGRSSPSISGLASAADRRLLHGMAGRASHALPRR